MPLCPHSLIPDIGKHNAPDFYVRCCDMTNLFLRAYDFLRSGALAARKDAARRSAGCRRCPPRDYFA